MAEQVILTINQHPQWGHVLQAVIVQEETAGGLSIIETASAESPLVRQSNDAVQEIVRLAEKISDKSLIKSYSKEKTLAAFYKNITPETIERYIRPFIETNHKKIIARLAESKLPLYTRKSTKIRTLYDTEKIDTDGGLAHVIFYFTKDEENGLYYFVRVKHQGKELSLLSQPYVLLCAAPAVMVVGSMLLVFQDIDHKKLLPFFEKKQIQIPASSEKEYIRKFVRTCVQKYEVIAQGISITETKPRKKAVLKLEADWQNLPVLNLSFLYQDKKYPADRAAEKIVVAGEQNGETTLTWFHPDKEWEALQIKRLTDNGLVSTGIESFGLPQTPNTEAAQADIPLMIDWLREHQSLLQEFDFSQQLPSSHYFMGEISMENHVETGNDWFDLSSEAVFGEFRVPFSSFRDNILKQVREYVLPDGSIAILPLEWFARYTELMRFGKKQNNSIRLQKTLFKLLEGINESGNSASGCLFNNQLLPPPEGLQATLRTYQQLGFSWMVYLYEQGFGGCMADDMGLGKTIQTISLLLYIQSVQKEKQPVEVAEKEIPEPELPEKGQLTIFDQPTPKNTPPVQGNTLPSLIVVPTSLVYNWVNELKRFAPSLMYYVHTGNKRLKNQHSVFKMFDVVITTYGTLRKDINLLQKCKFHHLVLDESQYIKNPASDTHKAVKQINALHKLALTGTPIENSLVDLWSIFDLLNPGMLGSLSAFKERYANNARLLEDKLAEERLLNLINPFILRRTKEQAAPELPPLQEETVYCDMSSDQQQYYEEEKSKLRNRLTDVQLTDRKQTAFVALQGLTKLRLLANHPALTDNEYTGESGKFEEIISRIRTLREEGHKVLVFSSFVKHLRLLSDYFELQGWDYAWLTGATDPDERERQINKFMNVASAGCFFVSLKAGGVGLNLTVADYVFILDPWWNPAAEMQALSRTHRIGQQHKVMAYRFITTDSIEEKIRRLQETKSQLADAFINNPHPLAQMNSEEITELIN